MFHHLGIQDSGSDSSSAFCLGVSHQWQTIAAMRSHIQLKTEVKKFHVALHMGSQHDLVTICVKAKKKRWQMLLNIASHLFCHEFQIWTV